MRYCLKAFIFNILSLRFPQCNSLDTITILSIPKDYENNICHILSLNELDVSRFKTRVDPTGQKCLLTPKTGKNTSTEKWGNTLGKKEIIS